MSNVNKICQNLGLPVGDNFTQDWAHELPDEYRTKKWLEKYILAYQNGDYTEEEKNELMSLSLDVSNDLLSSGVNPNDVIIVKVLNILFENREKHIELIEYWSLDDEPIEDCFALTNQIRQLKKSMLF
ncbi:hypothetical protein NNQ28_01065 [Cronobacter dublinensis]|uniref:hypothetical protein n=1 Tax=Cronobacter dublinensis TaxID=413497 RepID=UPI00292CCBEB|nr:hypothetical protein [Cronobacter dublinensis]WNY83037.1 hypothetical protein NNQ28_01065 [Cronobacter dublinensis]